MATCTAAISHSTAMFGRFGREQCGPFDSSTTTTVASTTTTIFGSTTTAPSSTTSTVIPPCTTEEIYGEDSEETEPLRSLRDNALSQTPEGQEIIKLYYQWSPTVVKAMEEDEEFKAQVKEMIDGVVEVIEGKAE